MILILTVDDLRDNKARTKIDKVKLTDYKSKAQRAALYAEQVFAEDETGQQVLLKNRYGPYTRLTRD